MVSISLERLRSSSGYSKDTKLSRNFCCYLEESTSQWSNSSIFRTIKPFKLLSCFSIHLDSMQIYIAWHSLAGLCSVIKAFKVFPYYTIVMVFILDNLLWLWSSHWLAKLGSLSGFNVTFVEKQILMSRKKLLKLS